MLKKMLMSLWHRLAVRIGGGVAYRFHLRYWFHPDDDIAASLLATLRPARAVRPELLQGPAGKRLVVLAPHPDDEVLGPGGTLIMARKRGVEITVLFLTDGELGADAARQRRTEAERVAQTLGLKAEFLGLPVDKLGGAVGAAKILADRLRAAQPDAVLVPFLLDDNDDHRATAHLLAQASSAANLPDDLDIWSYQVYSALPANVLVPLGDHAAAKADAIRLYASQMEVRDWANFALGLNAYNTRLAPRSCRDKHVEAFFVLPMAAYAALCRRR